MSWTEKDREYFRGWEDGAKHAIETIRWELLTLEADTNTPVAIDIYEILNKLAKEFEK